MTVTTCDVIYCDDIRQEASGKFLFIGVYSGELIPSVLPASIGLAIYLRVYGLEVGKHEFEVRVIGPSGAIMFEKHDSVEMVDPLIPMTLIFNGIPAYLEQPGYIITQIKLGGMEIKAGSLRVISPPNFNK